MEMSNIKKVRIEKGLTQAQLAEKSGLNIGTLRHYEQGSKNLDNAKIETLMDICDALDCKLYEIIQNEELQERVKNYCK